MTENSTQSEPNLKDIMAALNQATSSISALKQTVEKQAETISQLQTKDKEPEKDVPLSDSEKRLQDQINKLTKQNADFHNSQRQDKLNKALKDGLLARGVDAKRVEHALAFIKDRAEIGKDGSMSFTDNLTGIRNQLEVGLDQFCDSEDGSFYKAPKDVQGSGFTPQQRNSNPQRTNRNNDITENELGQALLKQFGLG